MAKTMSKTYIFDPSAGFRKRPRIRKPYRITMIFWIVTTDDFFIPRRKRLDIGCRARVSYLRDQT